MKRVEMKIILVGLMICFFCTNVLAEKKIIKMSTTTSTQASGLLNVLLPELEKDTNIQVKVIAKGTGAAIRDGISVVIIVEAPVEPDDLASLEEVETEPMEVFIDKIVEVIANYTE